jgi:cytoskeletal protein CcmA (bactofilin family)
VIRYNLLASIGVRGVARLIAGGGACVALLLAAAPAQAHSIHVETKTCEGTEEHRVIKGKLKVPAGAMCTLLEDIVEGDVSVGRGAFLFAEGVSIKGDLSSEGAAFILSGTFGGRMQVDGDVSIDATSGNQENGVCPGFGVPVSVCILAGRFAGNVSITNTSPFGAAIAGSVVAKDLTCTGNAFVTNDGFMNTVLGQEFGQCVGL